MMDFLLYIIGFMATAFTVSSTVPQIRKALRIKKSDDVSIRFILLLIARSFTMGYLWNRKT